jgi:hypothetical protein
MNMKGAYKLIYTVDKEQKEVTVTVELILRDGLKQPFKNLYVGSATLNGHSYEDDLLEFCVDAKCAAERIGHEQKEKIIAKYKKEGKRIKIKKEEIK